ACVLALFLAACTSGSVLSLQPAIGVGVQRHAETSSSARILATYPRAGDPFAAVGPMAADEVACRRDLRKPKVKYRAVEPVNQGGACRIDHPVEMSAIGGVEIRPAAKVTCAMAKAFAEWT